MEPSVHPSAGLSGGQSAGFSADLSELFWEASVGELAQGYVCRDGRFICLACGENCERGVVYREGEAFYEAEKALQRHIAARHGSPFDYLVGLDKKLTGLSDIQKEYLQLAFEKLPDREIARRMGSSESTVRGHRFKLREKAHQAKVLLALTRLAQRPAAEAPQEEKLVGVPRTAAMVDLRYAVTEKEQTQILSRYFDENGHLGEFPSKEKKKLVVLRRLAENFAPGRRYTEPEVNRILGRIWDDYATLRRELVEYGFLDRTRDGAAYWLKEYGAER